MAWDNTRLEAGFPFTFSVIGDNSHSISAGTIRHATLSADLAIKHDASGQTENVSLWAVMDPFQPDNDIGLTDELEEIDEGSFFTWNVNYTDDCDMLLTVDIIDDEGEHLDGYSILPFTPDSGGLTGAWDGVINETTWDPQPKFNGDALEEDEYAYQFFTGGSQSTWFASFNLLVEEEPAGEEPGPPGVVDDDIRIRVWGFKLDGHTFYVLRIGNERGTFVYDLTTGQWAEWASPELTRWRPHVGCNWVGMAKTVSLGGTDIVCGDDETGTLYTLDPTAGADDNAESGLAQLFDRVVTGGIQLDGREVLPCNAATLSIALGAAVTPTERISLETSDDLGKTFLNHGEQAVPTGARDTVVEWRSLGLAKAPGRLFRLKDNGATTRISSLDLR